MHAIRYFVWLVFVLPFGALACLMVRRFLPRRKARFWELGPLLLFTILFAMVTWVADENALLLSPFYLLSFLLCYGGPLLARLVIAAIFYPLLISIGMLIDSFGFFIAAYPVQHFLSLGIKACAWGLLFLLLRRLIPKSGPLQLSRRMWLLTGALSLAPLFMQLSLTLYNLHQLDGPFYDRVQEYMMRIAYTVLPFVTLSSLALLFTITQLSKYERLAEERQLEQVNRAYYEQLEKRQTEVRRLRHDMANHLQAIAALPPEEKDSYLLELLDSPVLRAPVKWSENRVVNAVLSAKAEDLSADHIRGDLSAPLPAILPFSDTDLCAVFANSLDNAIEACRKLPSAMRKITLKARVDKGLFALRVVNPCPEEPPREQGRFLSTKTEAGHGLGLSSIRSIAEKYNGSMQAGVQGGDFELLLYLPLK